MTRIDNVPQKGSARWEREYCIGYHNCAGCGIETPTPPQHVLDELAATHSTISTVWPFEHWKPAGWMTIREVGEICDACSRAVTRLLEVRHLRLDSTTIVADDMILRDNTRRALELAHDGLLRAFPPDPIIRDNSEYRYGSTTSKRVYQRIEDYRAGELRCRIGEIERALLGLPIRDPEDQ